MPAAQEVRDIRRATRKHHSAEDKIQTVLEDLHGEESIAALCRCEDIAERLYYAWGTTQLRARFTALCGHGTGAVWRWSVRPVRLWTPEEKDLLLRRAAEGATLEAVAAELRRTEVSVSGRAARLRDAKNGAGSQDAPPTGWGRQPR